MRKYIESQIRDRREKLQKLDRDRLTLQAELRAYEDMLGHLADQGTSMVVTAGNLASNKSDAHDAKGAALIVGVGNLQAGMAEVQGAGSIRPLNLSPQWTGVLQELSQRDKFTPADCLSVAQSRGINTNDVNVRSQLSIYVSKEILKRLGTGVYAVPEATKAALGSGKWEFETN